MTAAAVEDVGTIRLVALLESLPGFDQQRAAALVAEARIAMAARVADLSPEQWTVLLGLAGRYLRRR